MQRVPPGPSAARPPVGALRAVRSVHLRPWRWLAVPLFVLTLLVALAWIGWQRLAVGLRIGHGHGAGRPTPPARSLAS